MAAFFLTHDDRNTKLVIQSQERNMKTLPLSLLAVSVAAFAGGCTRPSDLGLAPLDKPAAVSARGAHPQSQITAYRQGVLGSGQLISVGVSDAWLHFDAGTAHATVDRLTLALADSDLPPSAAEPNGIHLRKQTLTITQPMDGEIMARDSNGIDTRTHGTLTYVASLLLDDGSLYQLGTVSSEPGDIEVRATRYEFGVYVTVDSAPHGKCLSIPGLIDLSNCSLYVESDGSATATE
jgi:hypothetical protein